ncbi:MULTISPECIES: hypothetical protein [Sulfurisphaera]|uniref:Uncharacterized protein n=2 Tax=Sulfurisphaera tokodaii TaxID=111955 RepID=F9VPD0_SULTO|nr:hypothetical protein [Sulfurisphaera tokodaii]BAK54777.1 hypothetical protein STK_22925 [Sulfurisphaera tokodaii str. 7]HII75115.1 hypothetical protein [Sulfurisphaera tokodaii]
MSELDLIFGRKKKEEKKETEIQVEKTVEENKSITTNANEVSNNNIEEIMKKFIDKDPKIGIWSYPSYLVLQYLYNTVPGFKMSRTAKEALERGLKEMYPDLFQVAEKVAKENGKI